MPYKDPVKDADKIKASRRKWYANNSKKAREAVYSRRAELKIWYEDFKSSLSCEHCGENHPATLDFHHKDPKDKDLELAYVISYGWSKDRILSEVEKCAVLCSNCHRKLHYNERQK